MRDRNGFSLIEILIATAIAVVVLAVAVIVANPGRQLAQARNQKRQADLRVIINAIRSNMNDTRTGVFTCVAGDIPTTTKRMAVGAGNYDIANCVVPVFTFALPFDPSTSSAHYTSNTDYDTGYYVLKSSSTGQITLTAPATEGAPVITVIQ